jgi:glyoxylase-like metal-dependent hydrolase (beta-lactamase superfamily II)
MNICSEYNFGEVRAFELGYGPIGRPLMNVFFYLIDSVLIDTGQSHMGKAFINILKGKTISRALLTHHHEDHSGNVRLLQKTKKVNIYGHPVTVEKMRSGFRIKPYQHLIWGTAGKSEISTLPEVIESDRYRFQPVHTPGHSKDHTAYFVESEGWLFSGDLYLGPKIKYFRSDEQIKDMINSLKIIVNLDFDSIFCAHNPVAEDGKKMMHETYIIC